MCFGDIVQILSRQEQEDCAHWHRKKTEGPDPERQCTVRHRDTGPERQCTVRHRDTRLSVWNSTG